LIGSAWAAISAPTMSAQRVTSSVAAKLCLAKLSARKRWARSASARAGVAGLVHGRAALSDRLQDRRSQDGAAKERQQEAINHPLSAFSQKVCLWATILGH